MTTIPASTSWKARAQPIAGGREVLLLIKDTLGRTLGYEWDKLTVLDKKEYWWRAWTPSSRAEGSRSAPF